MPNEIFIILKNILMIDNEHFIMLNYFSKIFFI